MNTLILIVKNTNNYICQYALVNQNWILLLRLSPTGFGNLSEVWTLITGTGKSEFILLP